MELSEFISNTVSEITLGIEDAVKLTGKKIGLYSTGRDNQRHIEFDVAVIVEGKNTKGGGGGIKVFEIIQVGGQKTVETKNSSVSRIKFGLRISDTKK